MLCACDDSKCSKPTVSTTIPCIQNKPPAFKNNTSASDPKPNHSITPLFLLSSPTNNAKTLFATTASSHPGTSPLNSSTASRCHCSNLILSFPISLPLSLTLFFRTLTPPSPTPTPLSLRLIIFPNNRLITRVEFLRPYLDDSVLLLFPYSESLSF